MGETIVNPVHRFTSELHITDKFPLGSSEFEEALKC
jgi:hypothetical protein